MEPWVGPEGSNPRCNLQSRTYEYPLVRPRRPEGVDGNIHTNGLYSYPRVLAHTSSSAPLSRTELLRSSVLKYGAG